MRPAATASLPALQPPAYQRHDTPLASSRSPMVGCVSGCFMTVLTRCGGYGGSRVLTTKPSELTSPSFVVDPSGPATARHSGSSATRATAAVTREEGLGNETAGGEWKDPVDNTD